MSELYIGVMSGTSLDAIDVSLCEIDDSTCTLLHAQEYPFEQSLKDEIIRIISKETTLKDVGVLHTKLGTIFGDHINQFIDKYNIEASTVTAIGLHGQTLWHEPENDFPFSMQLGCANVVHAKTNIQTVADFRSMDIANGGQGAPFAPAFHEFVFHKESTKTAVVNIGGMANITILGPTLQGWDTGLGNVLLDYWIKQCKGFAFDKDGAFAKTGTLNKELLKSFLADPYFTKMPPKTTGREYFNSTWLSQHLPILHILKDEDVQRTLLELTAYTITSEITSANLQTVIICGGVAKNHFLMQRLRELNTASVHTSELYNVDSDFMESMAFAWLAYKRVHKQKINLKTVTGARKNSILGAIHG